MPLLPEPVSHSERLSVGTSDRRCRAIANRMIVKLTKIGLSALLVLFAAAAGCAQTRASSDVAEPIAILELGGAAGESLTGDGPSGGPNIAVEVTPMEKWLEIEAGVTPLFGQRSTEWDTDVLFKKPWDLSDKVELMAGAGPEWIHTHIRSTTSNAAGIEAALDFMIWPSAEHHIGWYLEPAYDYSFGRGHEQSIGISGGLLIGLGRKNRKAQR